MERFFNVRGSQEVVPETEINVDTVYVRSNIHQIENEEGFKEWEYDEIQYPMAEYVGKILPGLLADIEKLKKG